MPAQTGANTIRVAMWTPSCAPVEGVEVAPPSIHDIERGWRFSHMLMTASQIETRKALTYIRALGDLLISQGLVSLQDLEEHIARVHTEMEENPLPRVMLAQAGDKYLTENNILIDCLERLPICQARCCTYSFCLSEQDLDEGVARWDYGRPYWMRKRANGYCVHCDPLSYECQIFTYRPYVCRVYDCREDGRIWHDFERMIPAPPGDGAA